MNTIRTFWQQCSTFEKWWCITFTVVGLGVAVFKNTPLLNMSATILGMWCVFLVAKGHLSNFYVGTVYVTLHAYISFKYGLYFMTGLYLCFYLPLQWVGWKVWSKHKPLYAIKHEHIVIREIFPRGWLAILIALIIVSLIYIQVLQIYYQADHFPWDSVLMIMAITGQLLMTWRFVEQWVAWICINIVNSAVWLLLFTPGDDAAWIFVAMWLLKIINAIYGWYNWKYMQKQQTKLVAGPYCPYQPQFTRRY
ncbi:nicotinamide riboside transporter PnuC [Vitreoscilla stercoraria]|uniref:Nicotinamide riboside transporter PnuC n=1 Tax=Vitreoscilla stercoraria TaxID=61 RepID=A0ABY4E7U5_VITST|nr:nicotinamide riboside transporter PnuC [Vitreoscilla stercoraria]UOO91838.1 nicotinamide riboside transporter PnuC [Vitreoscilla stercoraria]